MTEQTSSAENISNQLSDLTRSLRSALHILEQQGRRVAQDLEAESQNLRDLVAGKDEATQSQIGLLCQSVTEMDDSLSGVKKDLLSALSSSVLLRENLGIEIERTEQPESDSEDPERLVSAKEAGSLRHDEPVTLMSVIRSLLMADEPGQRVRRGSLD